MSAITGTPGSAASPSTAGTSRAASSSAAHRRAAARGDGADVEQVEAGLGEREPVGDRLLGRAAAGALEERVVGDVDDPGGQRAAAKLERAVREVARWSLRHVLGYS